MPSHPAVASAPGLLEGPASESGRLQARSAGQCRPRRSASTGPLGGNPGGDLKPHSKQKTLIGSSRRPVNQALVPKRKVLPWSSNRRVGPRCRVGYSGSYPAPRGQLRRVAAVARRGHPRAGKVGVGPLTGVHLCETAGEAAYESLTLRAVWGRSCSKVLANVAKIWRVCSRWLCHPPGHHRAAPPGEHGNVGSNAGREPADQQLVEPTCAVKWQKARRTAELTQDRPLLRHFTGQQGPPRRRQALARVAFWLFG